MTEPARIPGDAPPRRLFFALWPEPELRRRISRATRACVRAAGGRPVAAENSHITLVFLGNVAESRLEELTALAGAIRGEPFELVLNRLGFFSGPRSLWLGLADPCGALLRLQQALAGALRQAGWPVEGRPFTPHLTLARKARDVTSSHFVKPLSWPVAGFSLIHSVTDPGGAVYRELNCWPLIPA